MRCVTGCLVVVLVVPVAMAAHVIYLIHAVRAETKAFRETFLPGSPITAISHYPKRLYMYFERIDATGARTTCGSVFCGAHTCYAETLPPEAVGLDSGPLAALLDEHWAKLETCDTLEVTIMSKSAIPYRGSFAVKYTTLGTVLSVDRPYFWD